MTKPYRREEPDSRTVWEKKHAECSQALAHAYGQKDDVKIQRARDMIDALGPKPAARKKNYDSLIPSEHEDQGFMFSWWDKQGPLWGYPKNALFAIPNSQILMAEAGNKYAVMAYLRAEGFRDGMLDTMLAIPMGGYHGLFLELKKVTGGTVSPEQASNVQMFRELGYAACVRAGAELAINTIKIYLGKMEAT